VNDRRAAATDRVAGIVRARPEILRICSVFEPPPEIDLASVARFDPIGGMQNHTAELTRAIDDFGFGQTVVTSRPPGFPRQTRWGHVTVLRTGVPIPLFRQFYGAAAAMRILRIKAPDLVHAHLGEDLAVVPLSLLGGRRGAPNVLTIHCDLAHTFAGGGIRAVTLRSLGARLELIGARRASAVIVLSEGTRRAMIVAGVAPDRLHVIPPGVVPELFEGPFDDPLPSVPRPRVLFVGRIARPKNVESLIGAFALLKSQANLILVGDGPDRGRIENLLRSKGLQAKTRITGFVRHEHVGAYLQHSDVLILPSVFEELGSILLEGMCAGVPVVASRLPGVASIVSDQRTGLLVRPGDERELAAAIDRLLTDQALRRRLASQGREVARDFTWAAQARRIASIYESVLGDPDRSASTAR
jgi:glycogen synthase